MNLLITEINELRQRLKNFDSGKTDVNDLTAAVSVYTQTEKRMRLYLKAMGISMKLGWEIDADLLKQMLGSDIVDTTPELEDRTAMRGRKNKK